MGVIGTTQVVPFQNINLFRGSLGEKAQGMRQGPGGLRKMTCFSMTLPKEFPQGLKPNVDLMGVIGTTQVVPFQNINLFRGSLGEKAQGMRQGPGGLRKMTYFPVTLPREFPQGLKPNVDLMGVIGTTQVVPFQNINLFRGSLGEKAQGMRQGPGGLREMTCFPMTLPKELPQGLKPNVDLMGVIGTTQVVPFQNINLFRGSLGEKAQGMRQVPGGLREMTYFPVTLPKAFPQGLKPNVDLMGVIGTTQVVPFQNINLFRGSLGEKAQGMRQGPGGLREMTCFPMTLPKEFPQGLKPPLDSVGFVPGINPRPTARMGFSAGCETHFLESEVIQGEKDPARRYGRVHGAQ